MNIKVERVGLPLCRFLKAKSPYGTIEGSRQGWLLLDEGNTIFKCIRSSSGFGPDNGLVAPDRCVPGRSCFAAPEEEREDGG